MSMLHGKAPGITGIHHLDLAGQWPGVARREGNRKLLAAPKQAVFSWLLFRLAQVRPFRYYIAVVVKGSLMDDRCV